MKIERLKFECLQFALCETHCVEFFSEEQKAFRLLGDSETFPQFLFETETEIFEIHFCLLLSPIKLRLIIMLLLL